MLDRRHFLLAVTALALPACGRMRNIYQVEDVPLPDSVLELSLPELERLFILAAANGRANWQLKRVEPGVLQGDVLSGKRKIRVAVLVNHSHYSIRYIDSELYKATDYEIHKQGNKLLKGLDLDIRRALAAHARAN